jgi:hypothetical protein
LSWLGRKSEKRRFGPNCRDYSNWMVWAPERKRALYCGGGHNIDPMNDVWEYDLAANTWVCLSPADSIVPAKPRDQSLASFVQANASFRGGVVRTRSGGLLRPAHTWCCLVYDSDRRRMLWMDPWQGLLFTDKKEVAKGLGLTAEEFKARRGAGGFIWSFDPARRRWGHVQTGVPGGEGAIMIYLPDRKTLWIKCGTRDGRNVLYDSRKKAWKDLSTKGMPGYGTVGDCDPDSRTAVVINASHDRKTGKTTYQTWTYAFDKDQWRLVQPAAPAGGRDAGSHFHYDPVAKRFVLISNHVQPRLWLYSLPRNEWTDPRPKGDAPPKGRLAGYYDPARNVTVHYNGKAVWVYRCMRKEGGK